MHGEDVDIDADGEPDIDVVQHPYHEPEVKRKVTLRLNEMARSVVDGVPGRRNLRPRKSSGSEYSAGNRSASGSGSSHGDAHMKVDEDAEEEEQKPVKVITTLTGRRTAQRRSYVESEEDPEEDEGPVANLFNNNNNVTHHTRSRTRSVTTVTTTFRKNTLVSDDEGEVTAAGRSTRSRTKKLHQIKENGEETQDLDLLEQDHRPTQRLTRSRSTRIKNSRQRDEDDVYDATADHEEDQPGSSEYDEADHTSPEPEPEADLDGDIDADGEPDDDGANGVVALDDGDGKPYAFRRRTKQINYAIPPPLEEVRPVKGPSKQSKGKGRAGPGWSANGTELARYMGGLPGDDSVSILIIVVAHFLLTRFQDSDYPTRTPRKPFTAGAGGGLFAAGGGGMFPNDLATVGTPSNLGKVSDSGAWCLTLCDLSGVHCIPSSRRRGSSWCESKCHVRRSGRT